MAVVREATEADLDTLVAMGARFHAQTAYWAHFRFDAGQARVLGVWLLAHGVMFVAEREGAAVGMIGVSVAPHPMAAELLATELFWWVDPEARGVGLRLLRRAKTWAKAHGAARLLLIAPSPETVALYERMGLTRMETIYQVELE